MKTLIFVLLQSYQLATNDCSSHVCLCHGYLEHLPNSNLISGEDNAIHTIAKLRTHLPSGCVVAAPRQINTGSNVTVEGSCVATPFHSTRIKQWRVLDAAALEAIVTLRSYIETACFSILALPILYLLLW